MSNPKHWWYPIVKKAIMHYPKDKNSIAPECIRYKEAIEKALDDVSKKRDAEERRYAINEILFRQTRTIDGVAIELNYSYRVVQGWITEFVNQVGKYKGYETKGS